MSQSQKRGATRRQSTYHNRTKNKSSESKSTGEMMEINENIMIGVKSDSHLKEIELLKWENDLLKREKELREKEDRSRDGTISGEIPSELIKENEVKLGLGEIKTLIREFNPTHQTMTAKDWIASIEGLKNLYNWADKSALFYASLRLGGAAYYWYQTKYDQIRTYDDFKEELVKSFPTGKDDSSILLQIIQRKRMYGEAIEDYVYYIAALGNSIKLTDVTIIKYIISGLTEPNLVNILMASNCTGIPELLRLVKNYEELQEQEKARRRFNTRVEGYTGSLTRNRGPNNKRYESKWKRPYEKQRSFAQKVLPQEKEQWEKKINCFNCNKEGHYANQCNLMKGKKLEKQCYRCQQKGHIYRDCKNKQMSRLDVDNKNKNQDEYHKIINVEGVELLAFFDLGSECSTIKNEIVKENKWKMEDSDAKLIGFGGQQTNVIGKILREVIINGIKRKINLMVVNNEAQSDPVIIGRNFMDHPNIKIIKNWGTFEILETTTENNEVKSQDTNKKQMKEIKITDLNVNESTNQKDKDLLISVVKDYRDCFATTLSEIGRTNLVQMRITIKEEKKIRYHPYKVAYGLKSTLRKQIKDLLDMDIIQPSTSEYASPVLLIPKKNGEHRMCVDYRRLNSITKRELFPVPNIEETLNSLANKRVFTTLDMFSGYYQVPIEKGSRHLTAFITPEGHYEFKRVPFGLTNSPAVFMRLISKIIQPIGQNKITTFMDDILISTENVKENMEILTKFLEELRKAGLTLNLSKCHFFENKISFLGHEVSEEGVKPGEGKTTIIKNYKRPENAKEVKQFLGLTGYFRRFIQGFSTIAQPLHQLLKKDVQFEWKDQQEQAYKKLKEMLSQRPILTLFNEDEKHEVHTDASSHGIAGILMQIGKEGGKPVSYFSRATTNAESKYHSYELESLAVVESLERFKHYLLQRKFKVVTDCNSLRLTQEKKDLIPRIARWWLKIAEYDFELEFRSGNKMAHVDALSRCPVEEGNEGESVANKICAIGITEEDWLAVLQQQDTRIKEIRKVLEGEIIQHPDKDGIKGGYILEGSRVFKKTEKGHRLVVPHGVKWRVIKSAHDDRGHPGLERTIEGIRKYFWFPNMKPVVKKYLNSCMDCLYNKRGNDETRYQMFTPERLSIPFHTVHIDHLGPYPKSKKGNCYVIGVVDSFTKYVVLRAVKTAGTTCVIRMLEEMNQYFGVYSRIISDRGTSFTSKEFKKYCQENDVKHVLTAVKTPRANGQVERYFRTVKTAISTMTKDEEGRDWDKSIPSIQWTLNNLKNSTTKVTPQQLVLTYTPRDILKNKLILALHDTAEQEEEENLPISVLKENVLKHINKRQSEQAEKFNSKHKKPQRYQTGDLVLIRQEPMATGHSRKAQPRYRGPFVVKKALTNDRYIITDTEELQMTQKPYESVQSAERMKPWCNLTELDWDEIEESVEDEMRK